MHTIPQTTTDAQFDAALRTLAAQAATRYPDEHVRLNKGLVLALNSHVTLHPDGTATVQSGTDAEVQYQVGQGDCDCPDFTRAPNGHCKHRFAVALVKKAHTTYTHTRIAYHATYKGAHGMAMRDEHGRVWFQDDTDVLIELFDYDRPNLQLHGRIDLVVEARLADLQKKTDLSRLEAQKTEATILAT